MTTSADSDIKDLLIGLEKRLDEKINTLDKKIDGLDKKIEVQTSKMEGMNQRLDDLKEQVNKQDNRFFSLIGILATALFGILAKVVFLPSSLMK